MFSKFKKAMRRDSGEKTVTLADTDKKIAFPVPYHEAPPAYQNLGAGGSASEYYQRIERVNEDSLDQLTKYDTQFLIDDSRSMSGSRWTRTRDALAGLAKVVLQYDDDGIEIFFLNAVNSGKTVKTPEDVMKLFDHVTPSPGTPTGARLEQILSKYISRLEMAKQKSGGDLNPGNSGIKPLNLIVITDGAPSDSPERVIIAASKRLDAGDFPLVQVGIQFIQVGSDVNASKALKDMDDHLGNQNGLRDIVDTRPFSGKGLTADHLITMLVGGINRRIDRMENVPEMKN